MKDNGLPDPAIVYVVGNKKDIGTKAVEPREVNKFCKKRGFYFMMTSALTGENVNKLFDKLFQRVVDRVKET